jgi:hypothetical protein
LVSELPEEEVAEAEALSALGSAAPALLLYNQRRLPKNPKQEHWEHLG